MPRARRASRERAVHQPAGASSSTHHPVRIIQHAASQRVFLFRVRSQHGIGGRFPWSQARVRALQCLARAVRACASSGDAHGTLFTAFIMEADSVEIEDDKWYSEYTRSTLCSADAVVMCYMSMLYVAMTYVGQKCSFTFHL